jgi:hypothetical protein
MPTSLTLFRALSQRWELASAGRRIQHLPSRSISQALFSATRIIGMAQNRHPPKMNLMPAGQTPLIRCQMISQCFCYRASVPPTRGFASCASAHPIPSFTLLPAPSTSSIPPDCRLAVVRRCCSSRSALRCTSPSLLRGIRTSVLLPDPCCPCCFNLLPCSNRNSSSYPTRLAFRPLTSNI